MSKAEEIEEKIKEKRTVEANKKGLIGQNGKLGIILKSLGSPIIEHSEGGGYVESNYMDLEGRTDEVDLHELNSSEDLMKNIPIIHMKGVERPQTNEWNQDMPDPISYGIQTIGLHFDGLNRGMHLEIKYDNNLSELVVYHRGYLVYKEIKGDLFSYIPNEEWERWIDSLYKVAKEKHRKQKEEDFKQTTIRNEKDKKSWLEKIKSRWGV
jgi:hypothetical protein